MLGSRCPPVASLGRKKTETRHNWRTPKIGNSYRHLSKCGPWAPYNASGADSQGPVARGLNVHLGSLVLYVSTKCANVPDGPFLKQHVGICQKKVAHFPT